MMLARQNRVGSKAQITDPTLSLETIRSGV